MFWVSVPVLSEQRTSIPAISSIAASLLTIAFLFASAAAPTAIVTDSTAGRATGMAATVKTNANCSVSIRLSWRNMATMKMRTTREAAKTIR